MRMVLLRETVTIMSAVWWKAMHPPITSEAYNIQNTLTAALMAKIVSMVYARWDADTTLIVVAMGSGVIQMVSAKDVLPMLIVHSITNGATKKITPVKSNWVWPSFATMIINAQVTGVKMF